MSIYLIILITLVLLSALEVYGMLKNEVAYYICFLLLSLFLCLRYGQGTDYFSYVYGYNNVPITFNIVELNNSNYDVHGEIGWKLLYVVGKLLNIKFEFFALIIGLASMLLINHFIMKHCTFKILALLMLYPTTYLTYLFSGMRQGLSAAVCIGCLIDLYHDRKYLTYVIVTLICTSFHTVSILFLLVFLTQNKLFNRLANINAIVVICFILGIVLGILGFNITVFDRSFNSDVFSFMPVAERIVMFIIAQIVYINACYYIREDSVIHEAYKIYAMGFMIYGIIFMSASAQRITMNFKIYEILIICACLSMSEAKTRNTLGFILIIIQVVMTIKNINSYIQQGLYYSNVNLWNYPYVTIFNKSDILNYRKIRATQAELLD